MNVPGLNLVRLKWLTIVLAISYLLVVQGIAMGLVMHTFGKPLGHAVSITAYSAGAIAFATIIFGMIGRMQGQIVRQNADLAKTNVVAQELGGSLDVGQAMDCGLANVMKISGVDAGEIVVNEANGRGPRRRSVGVSTDLDELSNLLRSIPPVSEVIMRAGRLTVLPLRAQGVRVGEIRLLLSDPITGLEANDALVSGIAGQIAMAVKAGQLFEDVIRQQRTTQALYDIAVDITSVRDAHDVLWPIAERTREMLRVDAVSIGLFDEAEEGLTLAAWSAEPSLSRSPHPAGSWFPSTAAQPSPQSTNGDRQCCPIANPSLSHWSAPLCVGSKRIGVLSVAAVEARAFDDEDFNLLHGLAGLAAIAVQKSRLLQGERQIAVLEERQRLAREMHDSLAQVLGYLHLRSETALRKLDAEDIPRTREQLQEMSTIASEAYADVREAILGLREGVRARGGFFDCLQDYLEKFSRQAGFAVRLETAEDSIKLDPEAEVQLLRVIQEALTNVRKHARANEARVSICRQGGDAVIVVQDDGRGFDPRGSQQSDGVTFGLKTMRERVERAGGRFMIDSVPNEGTSVRIFFPLNGESPS